jgi:hypothetical protein
VFDVVLLIWEAVEVWLCACELWLEDESVKKIMLSW